jgi:uncharacterized protein
MNDNPELTGLRHPAASVLFTLVIVAIGAFVGPMIGLLAVLPFVEGGLLDLQKALGDPLAHPEIKVPFLVMQGFGTLIGMILIPWLFLNAQRRKLSDVFKTHWYAQPVVIVILIVIVFMGVNSFFVEWNQGVRFPFWDDYFRDMEEKLAEATKFITHFDSTSDLLIAAVVIAILPAIGEELVFRGMIQNDFYRATGNPHVAIWVAAIIFSAIHFQFFGFLPRLLLGALFGYIYYWSGSLWLAVLAHFVNNGFTIVGLYLYQRKIIDLDVESTQSVPWQGVLTSAVLTIVLLYMFKTFWDKKAKPAIPE